MPQAQCLPFTSPSSSVLSKPAYLLLFLAALQESAKKERPAGTSKHSYTSLPENTADYELSQGPSRCEVHAPFKTFVVDSKAKEWFKFQRLVDEWRKQRGARSSITETVVMPAYQEIIGMGEKAIPLLLGQLRSEGDEPDQWFWALRAITGENPVKPEEQGNFRKMAKAWLKWSEQNVW